MPKMNPDAQHLRNQLPGDAVSGFDRLYAWGVESAQLVEQVFRGAHVEAREVALERMQRTQQYLLDCYTAAHVASDVQPARKYVEPQQTIMPTEPAAAPPPSATSPLPPRPRHKLRRAAEVPPEEAGAPQPEDDAIDLEVRSEPEPSHAAIEPPEEVARRSLPRAG